MFLNNQYFLTDGHRCTTAKSVKSNLILTESLPPLLIQATRPPPVNYDRSLNTFYMSLGHEMFLNNQYFLNNEHRYTIQTNL